MPSAKEKKIIGSQYSRCVVSAQELALQKVDVRCDWFPHHNIDAYLKTDYQACINYFKSEADKTSRQRFRQDGALHRVIVSYYMMAAGHAVIKPVKDIDINLSLMEKLKRFVLRQKAPDSFCTNIHSPRGFAKLMRIRPKLFCINDTEKGSVENVDVKIFLEKMFPDKCDFEL